MNVLIIGMGAVGKALHKIVSEVHNVDGFDLEAKDINPKKRYDVLEIAYPYYNNFIEDTSFYIRKFNPKLTLIESTVIPQTTSKIFQRLNKSILICHSPVKGRHVSLEQGLRTYTKFIGGCTEEASQMAKKYYGSIGFKTFIAHSSLETEFAKLMILNYFACRIAMFQEFERLVGKHKLKFDDIKQFFSLTQKESVYADPIGKIETPIMEGNVIGGTCVIPAVEMFSEFMTEFSNWILASNKKRKEEQNIANS